MIRIGAYSARAHPLFYRTMGRSDTSYATPKRRMRARMRIDASYPLYAAASKLLSCCTSSAGDAQCLFIFFAFEQQNLIVSPVPHSVHLLSPAPYPGSIVRVDKNICSWNFCSYIWEMSARCAMGKRASGTPRAIEESRRLSLGMPG